MNKFIRTVCLSILIIAATVWSQQAGFNEGAIGLNAGYTKLEMKDLNTQAELLGINNFADDYYIFGGEIFGNLTPLFQMGFRYQYAGNEATAMVSKTVNDENYKLTRSLRHTISHYDLSLTYKTSISGSLEYFIGGTAGLGKTNLVISQDIGDQSFADLIDSFEPGSLENSLNRSLDFSAWLWVFEAQNGVRFHLRKGMAVGFNVAYQAGFTVGKGSVNHEFENITNLPDLDFKSVKYGIGLYFGN